jgi:hypothetical protein
MASGIAMAIHPEPHALQPRTFMVIDSAVFLRAVVLTTKMVPRSSLWFG